MAHTMKSQVSFTSSTVKMSGIRIESTTSRQMSYPFIEVKNESKSSGGRVVHIWPALEMHIARRTPNPFLGWAEHRANSIMHIV